MKLSKILEKKKLSKILIQAVIKMSEEKAANITQDKWDCVKLRSLCTAKTQ